METPVIRLKKGALHVCDMHDKYHNVKWERR